MASSLIHKSLGRNSPERLSFGMTMRQRGFNLFELVLVVSITGILGAVAMPKWARATQRYQVDMAALRIASDIALAQQRANATSTSVTISFNSTTHSYQIIGMPDFNRPSQTYTVNLQSAPYEAKLSSINFNSGFTLTFNGYGAPQQGGSLIVTVADRQKLISVDAASGKVSIQ